jgi:flagellin-like hook-associated protein FlgL
MTPVSYASGLTPLLVHIRRNSDALGQVYERLVTGLRINRASDDPGGLALASQVHADRRVYTQGVRNVSDGVSHLNVADAAVGELKTILARLRELATQSSNATYSFAQRQPLDAEVQALVKEYNRVVETTEFNGRKVFDTANAALTVQAGYGPTGSLTATFTSTAVVTAGSGAFQARVSYADGSLTASAVAGDFNGDGKVDLVSASSGDGRLNVFLGNGDGTFKTRVSYDAGLGPTGPSGLAVADFNGDGYADLLSTAYDDDRVSVFLGNGDGTFKARTSFQAGDGPAAVAVADVNGDGKVDLVSTAQMDNRVNVFLGNGNGTFNARVSYATGAGAFGVAAADFNGDGFVDLVSTAVTDNRVDVFLGNGNGTFKARTSYATGAIPQAVTAADLNGDAYADLVSTASADDRLDILLGNGNGTFKARVSYDAGSIPLGVDATDLNGDGKVDLVSASYSEAKVNVFFGTGDGTLQARVSYAAGSGSYDITVADFNGDRAKDIAGVSYLDGVMSVFLGNPVAVTVPARVRALTGVSVRTALDAVAAQNTLADYQAELDAVRGAVGAGLSRFEVALGNVEGLTVALDVAEHRITDADTASDIVEKVRLEILLKASTGLVAQAANQSAATVLELLKAEER